MPDATAVLAARLELLERLVAERMTLDQRAQAVTWLDEQQPRTEEETEAFADGRVHLRALLSKPGDPVHV